MSEWILNTGKCPVDAGTLVDVAYRNGGVAESVPALVYVEGRWCAVDWSHDGSYGDIIRWRLAECRSAHCECSPDGCGSGKVDMRAEQAQKVRDAVFEAVFEAADEVGPEVVIKALAPNVNPKAAIGSSKLPLHLASPLAVSHLALGLANGAGKYGVSNFKATPILMSIYLDATLRHLFALMEGEECDLVDGVPHTAAIMANMAIILEAKSAGTLVDDRQIGEAYLKHRDELTKIYQGIQELYKDKAPRHYTRNNA